MLPYFLLIAFSAVLPLLFSQVRVKGIEYDYEDVVRARNKMTVSIFFIGLFILMCLRDLTVGKDLVTYESIFEKCMESSFEELTEISGEVGYNYYSKLISMISTNYRFFLIVTTFVILVPVYMLYSREERLGYLLIVLFINMPCFLMMFSGLRQAIATSIGVLAYIVMERMRNVRGIVLSVVLVLLAMQFHTSAFVLFLLYPALFLKIKTKHLFGIVPALIAVFFFRTQILGFILTVIPPKYIEFYGEIEPTGAVGMMLLFLIFLVFSFVMPDEETMTEKDYFMRNMLLIATVIQFFVPIHGWVQRVSYYFFIFVPVSILRAVQRPKRRLTKVSKAAIVVLSVFFTVYFFYMALYSTNNLLDVFPYKFFWTEPAW